MSVMNALKFLGVDAELTNDSKALKAADNVIFPGVGAYYDSMQKIRSLPSDEGHLPMCFPE